MLIGPFFHRMLSISVLSKIILNISIMSIIMLSNVAQYHYAQHNDIQHNYDTECCYTDWTFSLNAEYLYSE